MEKEMKQVVVGIYEMGYIQVELVLREDTGGEFYRMPEKGKVSRIKIGADYDDFKEVINCLFHEALELCLDNWHSRYTPDRVLGNSHEQYLFVFDHHKFTDICYCTAEFVTACWSDLQKEWLNWRRK